MKKRKSITNYRQLFAVQQKVGEVIKLACPTIDERSGIYFYTRTEEDDGVEKKYAYIGKAVNLLRRAISHSMGYEQRIDVSLKKRGFYSPQNQLGWKLNILHFPPQELDQRERFYIEQYRNAGISLYNIENGGGAGKVLINKKRSGRKYADGLEQGYSNAQHEVANWFDKSLEYSIKGKENANKVKAKEKFEKFLKGGKNAKN